MDDALDVLLHKGDESEDSDSWTVADLEAERGRWKLLRPEHMDLFVMWQAMSGMGGESLYDLWRLFQEPGSAALLIDFSTLNRRLAKLRRREKRRKHD